MKLTATGAAKIAAANAGGPPVLLTQMAVGDGAGAEVPAPTGNEVALINEVWRAALTGLRLATADNTVVVVESVVPSAAGGWTVRELGVIDAAGALFAYANFPATVKTIADDGAVREMRIRASIKVASAANVTIVVDNSLLATTPDEKLYFGCF